MPSRVAHLVSVISTCFLSHALERLLLRFHLARHQHHCQAHYLELDLLVSRLAGTSCRCALHGFHASSSIAAFPTLLPVTEVRPGAVGERGSHLYEGFRGRCCIPPRISSRPRLHPFPSCSRRQRLRQRSLGLQAPDSQVVVGCLSGMSAAAVLPHRCRLQAHICLSGCHGIGDSSGKATVWFRAQPSCSMLAVDVGCCFCIGCMGADRATNHCP